MPVTAGRARRLAIAALLCLAPVFSGCRIQASQKTEYWREGQVYPPPGTAEPEPQRAPRKNDLALGIQKFRIVGEEIPPEEVKELGDPKDIGRNFVETLLDAKVFKDVHYPVRDQKIQVEIEPVIRVSLDKNRGTNFVKVFPGIVFPWIDGFGFNYDHEIELELRVRKTENPDVICDTFKTKGALRVKRYPSIFWFAGIHASLFVLLIFETATTDAAVAERLAEKDAGLASREAIAWLMKEFAPTSGACPAHPGLKANATALLCVVCKRNLRYPILNRVNGVAVEPAAPATPPGAGGGAGTEPAAATGTGAPR